MRRKLQFKRPNISALDAETYLSVEEQELLLDEMDFANFLDKLMSSWEFCLSR